MSKKPRQIRRVYTFSAKTAKEASTQINTWVDDHPEAHITELIMLPVPNFEYIGETLEVKDESLLFQIWHLVNLPESTPAD